MNSAPPTAARTLTVNADMGESIAIHSFGNDDALLPHVDLINLACGFHAGGPDAMSEAVHKAVHAGVRVGAHPGLPDLSGFGRREMQLDSEEIRNIVRYQVGALVAFLGEVGAELNHIKPHGALYRMVSRDAELMGAVCDVAEQYAVPVLGLSGTQHEAVARSRGIGFIGEFYVDLDYADDFSVVVARRATPRTLDEAGRRLQIALSSGTTRSLTGRDLPVSFESVCIHSDLPNAPEIAGLVRSILDTQTGESAAAP